MHIRTKQRYLAIPPRRVARAGLIGPEGRSHWPVLTPDLGVMMMTTEADAHRVAIELNARDHPPPQGTVACPQCDGSGVVVVPTDVVHPLHPQGKLVYRDFDELCCDMCKGTGHARPGVSRSRAE